MALGACRYGYELLPRDEAAGGAGDAGEAGVPSQGGTGGSTGGVATGAAGMGGRATTAGAAFGGNDAGAGGEAGAVDDWFDPGYAKRRRVTFINPGATELLDFVVPVVLTPNELDYAVLQAKGEDLLFVDADDQAELMPTASNDERHRVWGPLLKQHNLETVRHAIDQGAQLGAGKHASLWRGRRNAEREHEATSVDSSDARPVLDVSLQAGPTPFAKLLAHVQASNPGKNYDDCTELAMQLNRTHRIIAA